jgi:E3 ubiquitin-protein ligase NEDD4
LCFALVSRAYYHRENDITDVLEQTMSVEDEKFGEVVTVDLIANGRDIPVTQENKHEYVECVLFLHSVKARLVTQWRIVKRVEPQFNALFAGLTEVVSVEALSVFNDRDLELLIGGIPILRSIKCRYRRD